MKLYLYALFDEREPESVRYVGISINAETRLRDHISEARRYVEKPSYKSSWIRCLLFEGRKPSMRILETVETFAEANVREIALIAEYKKAGHRLTNVTGGGDASDGMYWTNPEARERQRQSMLDFWASEEGKAQLERHRDEGRKSQTGHKHSPETIEKMRLAKLGKPGTPRTEEWKAKIRDAQKGIKRRPWTEEERARHMAGMNREKMSASAKARQR